MLVITSVFKKQKESRPLLENNLIIFFFLISALCMVPGQMPGVAVSKK